ncbi:transposase [Streptomyces mirabilis]|uniref:transposase n=1 Tax=Streptomyces mirabilis TaxID=68239 RepID=UPI0037918160
MATLLRTVFEQPDTATVQGQTRHVLDVPEAEFPEAAAHLNVTRHEPLAFAASPREIWRKIWSKNPLESLNKTIRRSG